ncbi:unnamed protein product [Caenorhabditis auriculariae]|uniref:Uncharacterized protein n=1 Tax=Caenorhabditis auriculariae TaxID=2777116 RepID=A0A8S1HWM1_9PELO|nr:unnamed protein product [Caenorhabditis auriculariae]
MDYDAMKLSTSFEDDFDQLSRSFTIFGKICSMQKPVFNSVSLMLVTSLETEIASKLLVLRRVQNRREVFSISIFYVRQPDNFQRHDLCSFQRRHQLREQLKKITSGLFSWQE